jgi:hypothetical protein
MFVQETNHFNNSEDNSHLYLQAYNFGGNEAFAAVKCNSLDTKHFSTILSV